MMRRTQTAWPQRGIPLAWLINRLQAKVSRKPRYQWPFRIYRQQARGHRPRLDSKTAQTRRTSLRLNTVVGLVLLLPLIIAAKPVSPYRFQQVYAQNAAAAVRVRGEWPQGPRLSNGFLIDPAGYIVTVAPALDQVQNFAVVDNNNMSLAAQMQARHATLDIAILKVAAAGMLPALILAPRRQLSLDEWVVSVGHDGSGAPSSAAGCVAAIRRGAHGELYYTLDTPAQAGSAVLDLDGRWVAVVLRAKGARQVEAIDAAALRSLIAMVLHQQPQAKPSHTTLPPPPSVDREMN